MDSNTIVEEHLKRLLDEAANIIMECKGILTTHVLLDGKVSSENTLTALVKPLSSKKTEDLLTEVDNLLTQ